MTEWATFQGLEDLNMKYEEIVNKLSENLPFKIYTDFGISSVINKKILLDNFGNFVVPLLQKPDVPDHIRYSSYNGDASKAMEDYKGISINDYVKNYLIKDQDSYYFKSEDAYDFLNKIGLKKNILDQYGFSQNGRLSFWWGNKNTETVFHYDSYGYKKDKIIKNMHGENYYKEAYEHSILTVIEGKKKIYMIHPKYSKYLKYDDSCQNGAAYCTEKKEDILNNENIKYETIILNAGESLNIPMFWWHGIENLEETMAIGHVFSL